MNSKLPLFTSLLVAVTVCCDASDLKPKDRHVILISLDGFPAWIWRDPALPAPNLRRMAASGAATEAMTVSNPSITWINHTTLVTGVTPRRHGVLFNGLLVRQGENKPPKIEQWVDKTQLVFAPTLYDLAHESGLSTAEVDWVAVTGAKNIDWSFPERPSAEGKVEKEMISGGLLTSEQCSWFAAGPQSKNVAWRDSIWVTAAIDIMHKHKPNLLLLHTLNTDAIHHQNGPGSWASYTALAYADRLIGDILEAMQQSKDLGEGLTLFVTTDHGFKKVTQYVYPNIALKKAGYSTALGNAVTTCQAAAVTEGGLAFVYVTDSARKSELLPKLKELFQQTEGVAQVIDGNDGPSLGMPTPQENQGMGDLILYAKPGYAFNIGAAGEAVTGPSQNYAGTHGYPASDPELDGIFIATGAGIKTGVTLHRMANIDVAPTIAKLLDLKIPNVEGRVLNEILDDSN